MSGAPSEDLPTIKARPRSVLRASRPILTAGPAFAPASRDEEAASVLPEDAEAETEAATSKAAAAAAETETRPQAREPSASARTMLPFPEEGSLYGRARANAAYARKPRRSRAERAAAESEREPKPLTQPHHEPLAARSPVPNRAKVATRERDLQRERERRREREIRELREFSSKLPLQLQQKLRDADEGSYARTGTSHGGRNRLPDCASYPFPGSQCALVARCFFCSGGAPIHSPLGAS